MSEDKQPRFLFDVDLAERRFFDQSLLSVPHLVALRKEYDDRRGTCFDNHFRNYRRLLSCLDAIAAHNQEHARSYAKRIRTSGSDDRNSDAIFAEIIVYHGQLALLGEGHLREISLDAKEADLILTRNDGTKAFYEVFSIRPNFVPGEDGIIDKRVHTQDSMSSVRQKLFTKVQKQKQMTKPRENWAVVELNDSSIAGSFAVLSSLSDGYKISVDKETLEQTGEGYDWTKSAFDSEELRYLRGVVYFSLGNYADREVILNPNWRPARAEA